MAFIKFKPLSSYFNFITKVDTNEIQEDIIRFVNKNEKVLMCFRSTRDVGIFTDKRIILIDKKGIRGFRRSIYVIEYEKVSSYILNIGNFNCVIEFVTDSSHSMSMKFLKTVSLEEVYKLYKYVTDRIIVE